MKHTAWTILAAAAVLTLAASAQAGTITQALWLMGEDDPGAAAGNALNATGVDNSGNGNNLTLIDAVAGDVYLAPGAGPISSLAATFGTDTASYYSGNVSGLAANRGVEMWVRLTYVAGDRRVALATSGWSVEDYSGWIDHKFILSKSGYGNVGPGFTYTDDTWYNLALVTVDGTTSFYIDGVLNGSVGGSIGTDFSIGNYGPYASYGLSWNGGIDQVRVFDVDGTFDPLTDLTLSMAIPEPATMSLLVIGGVAALIRRRRS